MRLAALCLVLGACGQVAVTSDAKGGDAGGSDDSGAKSGTRLKIEWRDYGGTKVLGALWDNQRNERCYIYDWADGNSYCAPGDTASTAYSNAQCTQPIGQVYHATGCSQPAPPYLIQYDYTSCVGGAKHLFQTGPKVAVTQYYDKNTDGSCSGPYTSSANYDYYQPGAEVPTTALVKLARGAPIGTNRLAQRFYSSSDGAQLPAQLHDAMLGTDCYLSSGYSGATSGVCVPSPISYASFFHDAQCTQGEVITTAGCPAPMYAEQPTNPSCGSSPLQYFAIGSAVSGMPLYYKSDTTCSMTTPGTGEAFYTLGAKIDVQTLPRARDTTPGRSVEAIHYTDGTTSYRDYPLFDVGHNVECYQYEAMDKSVHCIPEGGNVQSYFKDANCTLKLDVLELYRGGASCDPPQLPSFATKYIQAMSGTCGYSYEVYDVAGPYTGALYQNYGGPTCMQITNTTELYYSLGALHPISEFPMATITRDP